ncbi:efflux RND transporter periplasmic adaptor subunit [Candidatus Microgenomates bacterium]|nr:efflux RND transporter periplasmic adaptor subunit [Candidatus Microgenomates bacterium]
MKKKVIIIIILFIIGAAFFMKKGSASKKESEFTLTTVKKESLTNTVSASGTIKADQEVSLKFQTSGKLAWVGVKKGDYVEKWQTIAQLDQRELKKSLEKELHDYASERWDFEQGKEDYDVDSDNFDKFTLTNEARRLLEKNQFDLEKAVLDVELNDIALKYAVLVTPIAGIITRIDAPIAGINITPATAVFTVSDPQSIYFSANIDEMDIAQIRLNQKTKVMLDGILDQEFEGAIAQIDFTSVKTSGGGTAFPIKIPLHQNEELQFKLGMNGDIEIVLEEKENVLVVPMTAVMEKKEKKSVWLVENNKAVKKEVKIGMETDESIEILEGLKEGDKIISKGVSKIKEGEKVN